MRLNKSLTTLLVTLLISGCSGHPGTGNWLADGSNAAGYWLLKVDFDGKATMLGKDQAKPLLGCYWQATTADSIELQCATQGDPENPKTYQLKVSDADRADFISEGQLQATFRRQG